MKDKAILAWANKMLRSFPAQWQKKMRIPQFRVEEALDEVTKGYNMAEEHIRHMETQTREELAEMLKGSIQKTLDKAQSDLEQLRVQLAGCLIASEGGATEEAKEEGSYAWSLALKQTVALHAESEAKDITIEDLKQKLEDADKDIANLRREVRDGEDSSPGGSTW